MRTCLPFALAASLLLGLVACSDDTAVDTPDAKVYQDAPSGHDDGGVDDGAIADQTPPQPDAGVAALLTTVVDKLLLPTKAGAYAIDIDGNGTKDNALGAILAALSGVFQLQKEVDGQLDSGALLLLFEVYAASLTTDPKAKVQFHLGADLDSDPTDNFSGTEEFGLDSASPADLKLAAAITSGALKGGPGDFVVPVPMGLTPTIVTLKKAQLKADLSSTGMQNGQINGAIPWTDVENKLIPAIAQMLTQSAKSNPTIANLFDANKDGTITATEVKNNLLIKLVLKPDLDLDSDGTKDALSAGLGFTATTCTIKTN